MSYNIEKEYQALLRDILYKNNPKVDRTGTGTISVFGRQIRHKMSDGFPLLTTKKMHWKSIVIELLWFVFWIILRNRSLMQGVHEIRSYFFCLLTLCKLILALQL